MHVVLLSDYNPVQKCWDIQPKIVIRDTVHPWQSAVKPSYTPSSIFNNIMKRGEGGEDGGGVGVEGIKKHAENMKFKKAPNI